MKKSILLVEDNASDEKLTVMAFKKCGIANEVIVMRDGAAALEYLFGLGPSAPHPAVILLDLKLPKVDGLEVLRRLRSNESTKFLPVIILSASREEEDVITCYALGANAYIRKPVEFSEFVEATKALAFFWLLLNETPSQNGAS